MIPVYRMFVIAFVFAFMLTACNSDRAPAEAALKAAEEALNSAKGEAEKYVPDQLRNVESALAAAKANVEKGEYTAALGALPGLAAQAKELASAASAKKAELTNSWTEMSGGLPGMVAAIKSRVDILSQSRRLPASISAEAFESAKSGLATITSEWASASSAFSGGNLMEAVSKANSVKAKATQIMASLGMNAPAATR